MSPLVDPVNPIPVNFILATHVFSLVCTFFFVTCKCLMGLGGIQQDACTCQTQPSFCISEDFTPFSLIQKKKTTQYKTLHHDTPRHNTTEQKTTQQNSTEHSTTKNSTSQHNQTQEYTREHNTTRQNETRQTQ